jgi:hypothetical protein
VVVACPSLASLGRTRRALVPSAKRLRHDFRFMTSITCVSSNFDVFAGDLGDFLRFLKKLAHAKAVIEFGQRL